MKQPSKFWMTPAVLIGVILVASHPAVAAHPGSFFRNLIPGLGKTATDVSAHECHECNDPQCIERIPVEECVFGKKKVYDSSIRYEYVSIPEVRYRWKNKWVTKEIPCEYCKPVCKTEDGESCYGAERWDKAKLACSTQHCKTIEPKTEKQTCKYCGSEPGKTTVKVRYKTCVKVPYTVYRRVKRPVCIKQVRYEKVEVSITRYKCKKAGCDRCSGNGCANCCRK